MGLLRQITKSVLTTCLPARRLLVQGPRTMRDDRAPVALTFDDGPHPEHTPTLLDLLARHNLTATFFVIGELAARYPEIVKRIVAEGHELANHTWTHTEPSQTPPQMFLDEVRRTDDLLVTLTGSVCRAMRPPKGELNWRKLIGLWRQQKSVVLWNVDPRDYRMTSPEEVCAWCRSYTPKPGDIVLMHDNHPWAAQAISELAGLGTFDRTSTVSISSWTQRAKGVTNSR